MPVLKEFTDVGQRIKQLTTMLHAMKDRSVVLWKLTWSGTYIREDFSENGGNGLELRYERIEVKS